MQPQSPFFACSSSTNSPSPKVCSFNHHNSILIFNKNNNLFSNLQSAPGTPVIDSNNQFNNNKSISTTTNTSSIHQTTTTTTTTSTHLNNNLNNSSINSSKSSSSRNLSIKSKEPLTHPRSENGTWKFFVILALDDQSSSRETLKKEIENSHFKFEIHWTGATTNSSFVEASDVHCNFKIRDGRSRVELPKNEVVVDFLVHEKIKTDDSSNNCVYDLRILQRNNPIAVGRFTM